MTAVVNRALGLLLLLLALVSLAVSHGSQPSEPENMFCYTTARGKTHGQDEALPMLSVLFIAPSVYTCS